MSGTFHFRRIGPSAIDRILDTLKWWISLIMAMAYAFGEITIVWVAFYG